MTPASFKRSIRDLQVWCSSCMVAFSGSDPIGVLIGAKRSSETLIHKIAVHPEYLRQGHAHQRPGMAQETVELVRYRRTSFQMAPSWPTMWSSPC